MTNKFTISSIEGIDIKDKKLLLVVHNVIDYEIDPLQGQETIELPKHGIVRLIIQERSSVTKMGSVSFSAAKLMQSVWLPLTEAADDFSEDFSEDSSMRILLVPSEESWEMTQLQLSSFFDESNRVRRQQCFFKESQNKLYQEQIQDLVKRSRIREEELLAELKSKDSALLQYKKEVLRLQEALRNTKFNENKARDELILAKNLIADLEFKLKGGNRQFSTPRNTKRDISAKTFKKKENVHREIEKTLNRMNLNGVLKKGEGNVYSYGNNSVLFDMKNNKIICKVAGGFLSFEEFIENSLMKFLEKKKDYCAYSSKQTLSDALISSSRSSPSLDNRTFRGLRTIN